MAILLSLIRNTESILWNVWAKEPGTHCDITRTALGLETKCLLCHCTCSATQQGQGAQSLQNLRTSCPRGQAKLMGRLCGLPKTNTLFWQVAWHHTTFAKGSLELRVKLRWFLLARGLEPLAGPQYGNGTIDLLNRLSITLERRDEFDGGESSRPIASLGTQLRQPCTPQSSSSTQRQSV